MGKVSIFTSLGWIGIFFMFSAVSVGVCCMSQYPCCLLSLIVRMILYLFGLSGSILLGMRVGGPGVVWCMWGWFVSGVSM